MKNKRIKRGLSFICIIALSMGILLGCQNSLDLKFNVKKGDKYTVASTSVQTITEEMNGQKLNQDQTLKTVYTYDVKDVASDGTATVDINIDSISAKINAGDNTTEYDSSKTKDAADPQSLAYGAMIGQKFTLKISSTGEIKEVSGVDKMFTDIGDKFQGLDQATKDSLIESLKQNFGDEALKENFGSMTDMYPKAKVKVGDSWESKQTMNSSFPVTINNNWTLKENKSDAVSIDVASTIDADNSATPTDLMGLKVKYSLKGTQKGTLKLTKANGFLQSGDLTQNLTGTMDIQPNNSIPNGMSIPVTIETKVTYEVTKK